MRRAALIAMSAAILLSLVASDTVARVITPVVVIVLPFTSSRPQADDEWMGEGVAQLISLGLAQHSAIVQIEHSLLEHQMRTSRSGSAALSQAARDVHADAVLYGEIQRRGPQVTIHPALLRINGNEATSTTFTPLSTSHGDFLLRVPTLVAPYARALGVSLTTDEFSRMTKAARPTNVSHAFELFARAQRASAIHGLNDLPVALLTASVQADPRFVVAQYRLSLTHQALGNRVRAAELLWDCVRLDPTMPEPYKSLGDLFLTAPRPLIDSAVAAYSKAIDLRPHYVDAHLGWGDAMAAKGNTDLAISAYQRAIVFHPSRLPAYLKLAKLYAQKGDCAAAFDAQEKAIRLDPSLRDVAPPSCPHVSP